MMRVGTQVIYKGKQHTTKTEPFEYQSKSVVAINDCSQLIPLDELTLVKDEIDRIASSAHVAISVPLGPADAVYRLCVAAALCVAKGNKSKAARLVGISRRSICTLTNEGLCVVCRGDCPGLIHAECEPKIAFSDRQLESNRADKNLRAAKGRLMRAAVALVERGMTIKDAAEIAGIRPGTLSLKIHESQPVAVEHAEAQL